MWWTLILDYEIWIIYRIKILLIAHKILIVSSWRIASFWSILIVRWKAHQIYVFVADITHLLVRKIVKSSHFTIGSYVWTLGHFIIQ